MSSSTPNPGRTAELARALEESEERYRALSELIPVQIWTALPDGRLDYVSEQTARDLGVTSAQLLIDGWQNVVHSEDLPTAIEKWVHSLSTGDTYEVEFRLKLASGSYAWHLARAVCQRVDGTIVRWFGTNTHIEEQRAERARAESLLGEVEARATELRKSQLVEQRALADAEAARSELHALFMRAPAPICILRGPDHVFTLANPAYLQLVGSTRELAGRPVRSALPELAGQGFYELLDGVYTTGERFVGLELPVVIERTGPGQGQSAFVNVIYEALRSPDGDINGILVMAFDVTDTVVARRSAQTALDEHERLLRVSEDALEKAEVASRAKDEFLATASHELRTPLNAILGWASLLRGGALDAEASRRGIDAIDRNARAQVTLIDDILDGSRIITGKLHLDVRPLDLGAVVDAAIDTVRPAAEARGITLEVSLDPGASQLKGDPDRLQQVVWNLVNNAIKFTERGGHVAVRLERVGSLVELTVMDDGQGISAAFLPYVFERFRQADGGSSRRHGGLGLGLALVRHLVEAHGGRVRAESAGEGQGATFVVSLPARATVLESDAPTRPTPPGEPPRSMPGAASLRGIRVLVVDDEPDVRDLVTTLLRGHGAEVSTASSAAEALAVVAASTPTLVVSDIGMPDCDGYELLRRVRAIPSAASVPAIALTAYSREIDRRRAAEAGFEGYLAKPVEPSVLVRMVAAVAKLALAPSR